VLAQLEILIVASTFVSGFCLCRKSLVEGCAEAQKRFEEESPPAEGEDAKVGPTRTGWGWLTDFYSAWQALALRRGCV
jgi:hypothetical protein